MDYRLSFAVNIMERSFVLCQNKPQHSLYLLLLFHTLCQGSGRSVHSGYLGHQKERGAILHDLRGSVLRGVTESPRNSVSLFSLSVSRDSCHLQVFVICQLSLPLCSASVLQFCEVCRICFIVWPGLHWVSIVWSNMQLAAIDTDTETGANIYST